MGIESKASYQDFCNGFCCQAEYTYIIAPKGVIPKDKIPPKIGFVEVDLKNYKIIRTNQGFVFNGVETVIQCKSRKKNLLKQDCKKGAFNMLKRIAHRSTVHNVFKNNEIKIENM